MRRIVVIGVVFRLVSVVTDTLDDQPADQGMVAHDETEGRTFHVDRDRAAHRSLYILKRIVDTHGAARGHGLDVTYYLTPLGQFRRRWRTFQACNKGPPIVEQPEEL